MTMVSESAADVVSAGVLRNPSDRALLRRCAEIHLREIPDGFLPTFGADFLTHLYDHIARSERSVLLVALVDGDVLGFICGSYGTGSLYKSFLVRKHLRILGPIARRLFAPGVLRRVWEILRYPTGVVANDLPGSEILNFCVSRSSQGRGIGRRLFRALCDEYRDRGISKVRIVTGAEQESARRFYESVGASPAAVIQVHNGVDSVVFVYEIDDSELSSA